MEDLIGDILMSWKKRRQWANSSPDPDFAPWCNLFTVISLIITIFGLPLSVAFSKLFKSSGVLTAVFGNFRIPGASAPTIEKNLDFSISISPLALISSDCPLKSFAFDKAKSVVVASPTSNLLLVDS